jgi:hypothetical protein
VKQILFGVISAVLLFYGVYEVVIGNAPIGIYAWTIFLTVCAAGMFAFNEHIDSGTSGYSRADALAQSATHYTKSEWRELCLKYNYQCLCCGRKRRLSADHVVPLYLGGSDDISNIQPLCKPCNSAKGTQVIDFRGIYETS